MQLLTETQAEVIDNTMTMAAGIAQTAYRCDAEEVHFLISVDAIGVLIKTGSKPFNLPLYTETHPTFPLIVSQTSDEGDNAESNGKGPAYYLTSLSYDNIYCSEDEVPVES